LIWQLHIWTYWTTNAYKKPCSNLRVGSSRLEINAISREAEIRGVCEASNKPEHSDMPVQSRLFSKELERLTSLSTSFSHRLRLFGHTSRCPVSVTSHHSARYYLPPLLLMHTSFSHHFLSCFSFQLHPQIRDARWSARRD
jgi:hypothetical protein